MSSNNVTIHHGEEINNSTGVSNKKLLMWAFLGSDVMFFGTFIGTFMAYRNKSLNGPYPADTLDIPITTVSTFVLLMSSLGIVLALHYLKESKMGLAKFWLFAVIVMGLIFMGFQVYEFSHFAHIGMTPQVNLFGSTFFTLTSLHGAHVSLGILWLGFLLYNEFNGNLTSDNAVDLEIAGLYWHFVDIVWIIIFGLLYLITAGDGVPPGGIPWEAAH
ncbi:MAG: cytochrome c oxidase subunit 3 [Dehalococcoidia bacterium]|jgi:heme/copper-type cytochrome/quinol oxidase subunit 3|nr:cytochrome c oxidase subunit 3 [Dehalococcoidia bacterium]MEC7920372.1 cytochrome c oxidase subunit 3 [Chloroflexota bacterium]MEC9098711.1 cytochrome c oxidase subunit 3 [Chloroflexota bacterium]MEC9107891.1 cytochrome c oxidase subunit 3 [Chloroflexota bacterium]MED5237223.1 cytochrome c oxidase subunit 3 [Chloroflexota bacterium]|tara:strand:- start:1750 stop:2400 length:651 start_codon:yes stop_codon:yes gene_type:complete